MGRRSFFKCPLHWVHYIFAYTIFFTQKGVQKLEELEELLDKAIRKDVDALEKILQSINSDLYRVAKAKLDIE